MIVLDAQHPLAQGVVAPEGGRAGASLGNERLDHGRRNGVAEQRGLERRGKPAGPGREPLLLHDAVVERGVGIERGAVGVVERLIGRPAILLRPARRQQPSVLPVAYLDAFAGGERHGRKARVCRRQGRVGLAGRRAGGPGERQQALARAIEDMCLLPEQFLNRKPIQGQIGQFVHPAPHLVDGQLKQFRVEPGRRLLPPRQQQRDPLLSGIDLVVALVLVVLQHRVVVDAVGQLAQRVAIAVHPQQLFAPLRQRAFVRGVPGDALVQCTEALVPRVPVGKDRAQVPGVLGVDR